MIPYCACFGNSKFWRVCIARPSPPPGCCASPKAKRRRQTRRFSVAREAPSPARPRRRGQAVRPVDRRRRRSAIGQCAVSVSISGLSYLSTSAAPPPPSSSPLPPAFPRLVSRAFGAPTGVPFGDDSARGGNKELRRWKTRGEGGLLPPRSARTLSRRSAEVSKMGRLRDTCSSRRGRLVSRKLFARPAAKPPKSSR